MKMKHAILTGFGPYKYNPTQDIVREYNKKIINNTEIVGLVLPCTYYGAFDLLSEKMHELHPDIILSAGLASRVNGIRIETIGRNIMNGKYPDAEGKNPNNEPLIKNGKDWYFTNSDSINLAKSLSKEKISAEISLDAEGFICNSLIYLTAREIQEKHLPIKFAFFHTPWTEDYLDRINLEPEKKTIKKDDLRKTIEILMNGMGE
jgi:pyroglutamyl-peptidase